MMLRRELRRWLYGSCPGIAGAFPYFGTRVYFPKGSIIFDAACAAGIYEADNLRAMQAFARDGTWVFDIGANIGLMSVPVLSAKPQVKVASYEASPETFGYLQRTYDESRFSGRWEVVPKAMGKMPGSAEFSIGDPRFGAYDGFKDTGRAPVRKTVQVTATTVDAEWQRLGMPDVSVIKLDVEGAELDVLKGAGKCVTASRPAIVMEWSHRNIGAYNQKLDDLLTAAKGIGYRVWAIPVYAEICDEVSLRVHSALTESFLLHPDARR